MLKKSPFKEIRIVSRLCAFEMNSPFRGIGRNVVPEPIHRISFILKGLNNGTRDTVICKKSETHDTVN